MRKLFFILATLVLSLSVSAQRVYRCDANNDGSVNTADVVAVYSYIIDGDASGVLRDYANVNGDDNVNSADVVAIYNYLITGQEPPITYTIGDVEFKMISVAGGTFEMGKSADGNDVEPVHQVTLSNYAIGETEVTQALWESVMGNNPSLFQGSNLPVETISWNDCQDFIQKLNKQLADQLPKGKVFRLPTEAEWEFAARGGNNSKGTQYSGSAYINDVAWYKDNSDNNSHAVGTKSSNELGIYDMTGNVWEYCQDWKGDYSSSAQTNPTGPASGTYRVIRGGCYWNPSQSCSTVYRGTSLPADRSQSQYRGFRLAIGDPIITSTSFSVDGVEFKMVEVEGGTFEMGATPEQENPQDVEKPVHNVTLSTYSIGQTEVTQALWTAVMGTNPSYYKANNLPVESVTYDDCKAFVTALNTKLAAQLPKGKVFRLPTEAEWEFAARGGVWSQGYQYSGSNTIDDVAWYNGNCEKTHSVAQKQANELGIYDMSGNVREWCFDWISGYSGLDQTNPTGSGTGGTYPARVVRGGSWNHDASYCRTACRGLGGEWSSSIGLRLVIGDPLVTPTVYKVGDVEFAMIDVEAGTFQMGSSTGGSDERPVHEVTLSSYAIGETEVTQALWKAVGMGKNPSAFISSDYLPVENVSWDDCQEFVNRLNTKLAGQLPEGKVFRLPTEAEWEFAARGGNKSQGYQYSGSNNLDDVAWYSGNSGSKTHVVQGKWVNELGLYDMSGNVWEWCQDWYGAYRSSAQTNPIGPASGDQKVIRGGCWANPSNYCCNSSRGRQLPANAYNFLGFRLVIGDPVISAVYNVGGVEFKMVEVEGGTFQMGSATGESNEQPVHEVTLSSYFIAEKEVTQALWSSVMDYNPSEVKGMNLPVTNVTWNDCQSFITKLNQKIGNGKKFRLPTEAEWEFAARGGVWSQGYQYSGSNTIDDVAWYNGNSGGKAQSVRQKQANELGLYDMTGNVWEWCQDWYGDYTSSAQTNPNGPASGTERVLRGASWYNYTRYCRTTYRHKNAPTNVSSDFGFRLAM